MLVGSLSIDIVEAPFFLSPETPTFGSDGGYAVILDVDFEEGGEVLGALLALGAGTLLFLLDALTAGEGYPKCSGFAGLNLLFGLALQDSFRIVTILLWQRRYFSIARRHSYRVGPAAQ